MPQHSRKIIHIDLDCFYAAVEIRDNPTLVNKPVAVGWDGKRGVLCTANYIARRFGVHSAMSVQVAKNLCKNLVIVPVNMAKYKAVAREIHAIFYEFTDLVEPLSLDEAYLDVTACKLHNNSATLIAKAIKQQILDKVGLTASAGVAPNKFLAKIACGINKPNVLYIITPQQVTQFVKILPVEKIFGVGKVMSAKLHKLNIKTCSELEQLPLPLLLQKFGKFGYRLYNYSRGIDEGHVEPNRHRRSASVETTFLDDTKDLEYIASSLRELHGRLLERLKNIDPKYKIKSQYIKIKYSDHKPRSIMQISHTSDILIFLNMLNKLKLERPIRLLGIGVRFYPEDIYGEYEQLSLF